VYYCTLSKRGVPTSYNVCDPDVNGKSACDDRGNLVDLNAANANLTGTISTFIGGLSYLTSLVLEGCKVSGSCLTPNYLMSTIPSQIGLLTMLTYLNLAYNPGINGTYPTELARLSRLTQLTLVVNQCTGPLVRVNAPFSAGAGCTIQFHRCADYLASPNCRGSGTTPFCFCATVVNNTPGDCEIPPTTTTLITSSTMMSATSKTLVLPLAATSNDTGAIVAGVTGGLLALVALIGVVVFIARRRARKDNVVAALKSATAVPGMGCAEFCYSMTFPDHRYRGGICCCVCCSSCTE
jgi:hypothetical protein